tara:strand:+ start:169 stop:513 length:345 start_codon:yes stop_codon:yes gene_type:complete
MVNNKFDLPESERRRDEGVALVASHNETWIKWAREEARKIARRCGVVSSDDVRAIADREMRQPTHCNAWGALFRTKEWVEVGRQKSKRITNHARRISVYTLRKDDSPGQVLSNL